MDKKVNASHLFYIILISVIILSFFLVIAFGGDEANKSLGTASTVSSLILSVVAIVLSLIDVAGQGQSIMNLKETADKLQQSNEQSQELIESLISQVQSIDAIKDDFTEQQRANDQWKDEIKVLLSSKGEVTQEDFQEIMKKEEQLKLDRRMKSIEKYLSKKAKFETLNKNYFNTRRENELREQLMVAEQRYLEEVEKNKNNNDNNQN